MFRYLIVWREDPNIWFNICGVSYIDAMKDTLKKDPEYFGAVCDNYLENQEIIKFGYHYNSLTNEDEQIFYPTPQQFSKCLNFHINIFKDTDQYIVFQINFISGKITKLEQQNLI
jgi:hypothetical protein